MSFQQRVQFIGLLVGLLLLTSCHRQEAPPQADHPRLTPAVRLQDVIFRSAALDRDVQYRVILPKDIRAGTKLPVLYLLHGGGGGFRDWSNYSDIAQYAATGLILVMPEGDSSYYTNAVARPQDRYEDYLVNDLIVDVESRFPVAQQRSSRAIAGVSMGGFGAVKLALKHPELYTFAAGISSALDVPTRPFSIKRVGQWQQHRSIFGDWNGKVQKENDPYTLARTVDPTRIPYLYLSCGDKEGLLPANRNFVSILSERHFRFQFHVEHGGHDWNQWNMGLPKWLPSVLRSLSSAASSR